LPPPDAAHHRAAPAGAISNLIGMIVSACPLMRTLHMLDRARAKAE